MEKFEAGKYISQGSYKSFQPTEINRKWNIQDMEVLDLLGRAKSKS